MNHTVTLARKLIAPCLVFLLAAGTAPSALAVKPKTLAELRSDCNAFSVEPEGAAARRCVIYVQGFLDGAVATDERVALNVAEEIERTETLTERAIRTRLHTRIQQRGPSYYAEYCVGDPVPIQEVVGHVIEEFEALTATAGMQARDIVYAALRRHYPCTE